MSVHETFDLKKLRAQRNERIAAEYAADVPIPEIMAWSGLCKVHVYNIAHLKGAKRSLEMRGRQHGATVDLAERNWKIVCDYGSGMSLEDVGAANGITRERVRQILVKNGLTERHYNFGGARRAQARARRAKVALELEAQRAVRTKERKRCVTLYRHGLKYQEIALETGRSVGWVTQTLRRAGAQNRSANAGKPRRNLTKAQKREIVMRWKRGDHLDGIARAVGCHAQTVYMTVKKAGATRTQR